MQYGVDFTIDQSPRLGRHRTALKKQLNVKSKATNLKHFNVHNKPMRNKYGLELTTPEGLKEYHRRDMRERRAKQKQRQLREKAQLRAAVEILQYKE